MSTADRIIKIMDIMSRLRSLSHDDRKLIYNQLGKEFDNEIQYVQCAHCDDVTTHKNYCKKCFKDFCEKCAINELSVFCPNCTIGKCTNKCLYGICKDCCFTE